MISVISLMSVLFLFDDEESVSGWDAYRALTVSGLNQRYACRGYIPGYPAQTAGQGAADDVSPSALDGLAG
jgi:hypothetical protein